MTKKQRNAHIARLRLDLKLSYAEIESQTGLSRSQIWRIVKSAPKNSGKRFRACRNA